MNEGKGELRVCKAHFVLMIHYTPRCRPPPQYANAVPRTSEGGGAPV